MTTMKSIAFGQDLARSTVRTMRKTQLNVSFLSAKETSRCQFSTSANRRGLVSSVINDPLFHPYLLPSKTTERIGCRTATVKDKEEIVDFLCEYFLRREPAMAVLKANKQDTKPFVEHHVTDALRHNSSFVAVDENGLICGIRLNAVGPVEECGNNINFGTKMNTLEKFLEYVEGDLVNQLHTPRIMRHIAICVNPDLMRSGVGTMLMQRSVDYAKQHGLRYMVATCTGKIATKLALKMGFRIVREVFYDSYVDPDSHFAQFPDDCLVNPSPHLPFLSLAEEHKSAKLMVKNV